MKNNVDLNAKLTRNVCENYSTELNEKQIQLMFKELAIQNPNPKSELKYNNIFQLLVAVVLSAQTTDIAVNKVTPKLFQIAPNAHDMAKLDEKIVSGYIKSIGLWASKAKNVIALSKILCQKYSGNVPDNFNDLVSLPGVGSKTAKVVLNEGFGYPTVAVDTHIFRVCNRTGFCIGKNPKQVEDRIVPLIPKKHLQKAHHYILLHGRYICKAQKPQCSVCVIKKICKSFKNKESFCQIED